MHPISKGFCKFSYFFGGSSVLTILVLGRKLTITATRIMLVDAASRRTIRDLFVGEASTGRLSASIEPTSNILQSYETEHRQQISGQLSGLIKPTSNILQSYETEHRQRISGQLSGLIKPTSNIK